MNVNNNIHGILELIHSHVRPSSVTLLLDLNKLGILLNSIFLRIMWNNWCIMNDKSKFIYIEFFSDKCYNLILYIRLCFDSASRYLIATFIICTLCAYLRIANLIQWHKSERNDGWCPFNPNSFLREEVEWLVQSCDFEYTICCTGINFSYHQQLLLDAEQLFLGILGIRWDSEHCANFITFCL